MFKFFKNILIIIIKSLIETIEKKEYKNYSLDENDISKKILNSLSTKGIKVKTDTGYEELTDLHITQPYTHYRLKTGLNTLDCADNHIVFDHNYKEVFVKDLSVGDMIQTNKGLQFVKSIEQIPFKSSMFDATVNHPNHRLYTNGILSHNTISSAIFLLHTIIFKNDKNVMIVANKGETTVEIVDKIKSIYTLLPYFLKPGVKTWNQKSLTFENGCRIKTSARTKTPAIGFTIDVLYLDEFAHIPSNIIEPYYTAAFPTVSAIQNSKIIITSTPNGMNLFHKILTDAEKPEGDPMKNNYNALRVYWHQVPGRFVTYIRLNAHKMHEHDISRDEIYDQIRGRWGEVTKVEMKWDMDKQRDIIHVHSNDKCSEEEVKTFKVTDSNGIEVPIMSLSEISTWKEDAIKDIGGEDAFNQEYGLRFINASKSLLDEVTIKRLSDSKRNYMHEPIDIFDKKLKFSYKELKWVDDDEIFLPLYRNRYKFILSVDLSEGLGQDYSVINIFKIAPKSIEVIEQQKDSYESLVDFFKLDQVGMYRSNVASVKQIAELLYMIVYHYLNPENTKVVLELNTYGNTLLSEMAYVFEGDNEYGSNIFFRFKHRVDSDEEKIGLRVGENKNLMVKDYQDLMIRKSFNITNEDTIREITTFVKHQTSSGKVKYQADNGHDDTVMTIVNTTGVFKKLEFKEMVDEWFSTYLDKDHREHINKCLNRMEYSEAPNYSQFMDIKRRTLNSKRNNMGGTYNPWNT